MPELRHDPILKQWVIIATERGRRPFDVAPVSSEPPPSFCPFCPGHEDKTPKPIRVYRMPGQSGPSADWAVRIVPNKYPALRVEGDLSRRARGPYDVVSGIGAHEVLIETPEHRQTLDEMSHPHLALLFDAIRERIEDLRKDERMRYIFALKNYGTAAGATLSHPYSQILATPVIPKTIAQELRSAKDHYQIKERCLFCDLLIHELEDSARTVALNDDFIAFCPFASRLPFEVHIYPRRHEHDFTRVTPPLLGSLARIVQDTIRRLKTALNDPPYNLMLHSAPNTLARVRRFGDWGTLEADYHWHLELTPRLTIPTGLEWGYGMTINPIAPENAAAALREVE